MPKVTLSDYQVVARDYLLAENFRLLADVPGVGKTYPAAMAGYIARKAKGRKAPVLITCPSYLVYNWREEIRNLIPHASVVSADGAGYQARLEALSADADFIITGYSNWSAKVTDKNDPHYKEYRYPLLVNREWSALIFDEGHRLRGRQSQGTKHFFKLRLAKSVNRETPVWMLTGTPQVRDAGDFFVYFHMFDKKQYGSYWKFVQDRAVCTDTPFGLNVGGIKKSYREEFSQELAQFTLRRTTEEIPELKDLESVETHYYVDMPPSVLKMIQKAKKEFILEHEDMDGFELVSGPGALYAKQRQLATNPPTKVKPKIDWLMDFLQDRVGKTVVYVYYKDSARIVAEALGDRAVMITGDVPVQKRAEAIEPWRTGKADVLVATISSLKEGINLTESNNVVYLEATELPSDIEQTTKRLLRRGQKNLVNVHYVWGKGTVDKAIKRVLEDRTVSIQDALRSWAKEEDSGPEEEGWF